jgi:hypothetical protein
MKLIELLTESLSTPYQYTTEWNLLNEQEIKKRLNVDPCIFYATWINDKLNKFTFEVKRSVVNSTEWEVAFMINKRGNGKSPLFNTAGTGDSFKTFATVLSILKDFVTTFKDKVSIITFSVDELTQKQRDSRTSLYTTLIKKYLPSNWNATIQPENLITTFIITKIDF